MNELLAACLAWVVVNVLEVHRWHRWFNRKPIACDVCLSGWFTLILNFSVVEWLQMPFRMAAAMILTIVIGKILNKL